jgi:hypothetical protein
MKTNAALMLSITIAGCASSAQPGTTCPATSGGAAAAGLAFPLAALRGPHARSVKVYLDADGALAKLTAYVERAGIPEWVHALADKEIGKGDEVEFEVEQYRDGTTVYEVTRKIAGKRVELAVASRDRAMLYIERKDLALADVPAAVQAAAAKVAGFTLERYSLKQRRGAQEHELEGKLAGRPASIYFGDDGTIRRQYFELPARVKIGR